MKTNKIAQRFNEAAQKYDEQRKIFIPFFEDYYESGLSYLSTEKYDNILELGAGTGLLSKKIYHYYPNAKYTLVDISEEMLEIAKSRFKSLDNFEFVVGDYSVNLPNKKYDLIVSALSIHHLENKTKLYKDIYKKLKTNGSYLNIDQYDSESKKVSKKYNELWINSIMEKIGKNEKEYKGWQERRMLDKETTVEKEIKKLKKVGFKEVECLYKYWKFAVVTGRKKV